MFMIFELVCWLFLEEKKLVSPRFWGKSKRDHWLKFFHFSQNNGEIKANQRFFLRSVLFADEVRIRSDHCLTLNQEEGLFL